LGVFKALSQDNTPRRCDIPFLKALVMYFHWKKIQPGPAEEIAFEIEEFFPTGWFLY
jgi:hypothetical protein